MLFKKKQAADERIEKRTNELCVKMFPAIWFVNAIFLIVKIAYGLPVMVYSLEILILVSGIAVWLIEEMRYGTLFAKEKDEVLKELSIKAKTKACFTMFWVVVIGEFIYVIFVNKAYFFWVSTYMLSWFPPCLIFTVVAISEGLLIFGSKKKEKAAKKSLVNRTVIGSIFFGFFMGSSFFLDHGAFNPKGLIAVPLIAAGFGFPFYFLFTGMMKISEKYADKKMTESEDQDEK